MLRTEIDNDDIPFVCRAAARHLSADPVPDRRYTSPVKMERAMQPDLEHFAERLVSGMSEAVVYADADGVIRLWNRGAVRVFGFTETEALGRSLDIIIPEGL